MSFIQALILGLIQGLTEFFPISSSAHLRLAKKFLGIDAGEGLLSFDLLCHSGTLIALLIYLRKDVWKVLCSVRQMAFFTLALTPLVPAYFLLKPVRETLSHPEYLRYSLMVTSALLFISSRKKAYQNQEKKWKNVLCIGLMQTIALVPGISRSGSTISTARMCGWTWEEAARFSFLLSIPTILGGQVLEMKKLISSESLGIACYLGGFLTSMIVGLLSVRFVFWIYKKEIVRPFAWYCLVMGCFVRALLHG